MKTAVVFLALIALGCSAPQPRKLFHEHFEDFMDVIFEEVGHELEHLTEHYLGYDEFWAALDFVRTANFKELVYEMETLPEFQAVVTYLENDNIDVLYFIDIFNNLIENVDLKRTSRHETTGKDFNSYINDVINLFPKEKLAALYEQKLAEDEEFREAMTNLRSEEWDQVFGALWASEVFQAEVQTLAENGIDISLLLGEVLAVFGQN